jgi:hypothetical protein
MAPLPADIADRPEPDSRPWFARRLANYPLAPVATLITLVVGVLLVTVDRLWLDGMIFGNVVWRVFRWLVMGLSLAVGAFAYLRRTRG